jgi:hypothetical protein
LRLGRKYAILSSESADDIEMIELNPDQSREMINSSQRFEAHRTALRRAQSYRGAMRWRKLRGNEYLIRDQYNEAGVRKQKCIGLKSAQTDIIKKRFEDEKIQAIEREEALSASLQRQMAINRALKLGRVPRLSARIIRALDDIGILGKGVRIVGTNSLFAYEAQAGVFFDSEITTTEDLDLLRDARRSLRFVSSSMAADSSIMNILQRLDKSFERDKRKFSAVNKEGFIVDLIRPEPKDPVRIVPIKEAEGDLQSVEVARLYWLENAPSFEAVAIDSRGEPVRIVTIDPRVFVAHKVWLSQRDDRNPIKKRRDLAQAKAVATLCNDHFANLPYQHDQISALSKTVFDDAAFLFRK